MANQSQQQPWLAGSLKDVPPIDDTLRQEAESRGVTRSLTAWAGVISNKLASINNTPATLVTISDQIWSDHIHSGKLAIKMEV